MKSPLLQSAVLALVYALAAATAFAEDAKEVTIRGPLECNGMIVAQAKETDHVPVVIAVDGSAEITTIVKDILDKNWPDKGLDADAAEKVNEQFDKQLKFFIDAASYTGNIKLPGGKAYDGMSFPVEVTGTVSEQDGKKTLKVSSIKQIGFGQIKWPQKMLAADQPFAMPDKEPLVIKINDKLSLNCLKIPPGSFMAGDMIFVHTRYQEQFPHRITLTKPYYISEIPITNEIWEAVMGASGKNLDAKTLQTPVNKPGFDQIAKFCAALSEKAGGKKVRLPTGAEWEYACRVGTSNPAFHQKYTEQMSTIKGEAVNLAPIKQKKPNAWGLYDMCGAGWEILNDKAMYPPHHAETDPSYPAGEKGEHMLLGCCGENWTASLREFGSYGNYTSMKFRVVVEADGADAKPPTDAPEKPKADGK
jgi:formylglycine-generating enzyme required for sulfatase activity